jgi:hypothetical protein
MSEALEQEVIEVEQEVLEQEVSEIPQEAGQIEDPGVQEVPEQQEVDIHALADQVHKLSSSLGRVKKSLIPEQPQPAPQQYQQPQQQYQQPAVPQQQISAEDSAALVELYGDEAKPLINSVNKMVASGVQNALAPYAGVLNQVQQAVQMSQTTTQNAQQLAAIFPGVSVGDAAAEMRKDGINEEEVQMFERNPGYYSPEQTGRYFVSAMNSRTRNPDKTGQILNNAAKKSRPVLVKSSDKTATTSAVKQLEGKSPEELSVLLARNPALRKQYQKELGK